MQEIPLGEAAQTALAIAAKNGVKLVLIGAHAVNLYSGKPRYSVDVDFIADKPELLGDIEGLKIETHGDVVRYVDAKGSEVLDFVRPNNQLLRYVLNNARKRGDMLVPDVESVLGLKYQSMMALTREFLDRQQDAVDFARVAKAHHDKLDRTRLQKIGALMGAGVDVAILEDVDNAINNRPISIP